ncbi:hypothetical protein B9Z55_000502 [Caenorhabditis nigoni]|uniref:C2H2-type domain-containing protein n=1 Tax=Caenorhabditis nigoni TaxID=1611254 RepID=A0A2G5VTH0_9PELO|nr:hypothetical protein B9Z55_000502 [Caenorhabditis nigoni]
MSENEDYQKFLEASGYIQQFTANLLKRNEAKPPEISGNLSNLNQLIDLVKQSIQEQRNLVQKVDAVNATQRNINSLIKEKLGKCSCDIAPSLRDVLLNGINVNSFARTNGQMDPNLPSTSSAFPSSYRLNQRLDSDLQQNFNLELILGQIKSSTTTGSAHFDHYENGNNFSNFFDSSSLDSSPNSKKNGGSGRCKKRQIDTQFSHLGPYQCRDCDKTFRQKHGLSQHRLTHESNGAFACDVCGKRYSRQESVNRHQRSTECGDKYHSMASSHSSGIQDPTKRIKLESWAPEAGKQAHPPHNLPKPQFPHFAGFHAVHPSPIQNIAALQLPFLHSDLLTILIDIFRRNREFPIEPPKFWDLTLYALYKECQSRGVQHHSVSRIARSTVEKLKKYCPTDTLPYFSDLTLIIRTLVSSFFPKHQVFKGSKFYVLCRMSMNTKGYPNQRISNI